MHFNVDSNDDQIQYPEKLDFNLVRLYGSHGRKAHRFSQLDTLTKQRCEITLHALSKQRYHLTRKLDTLTRQRDQLSLNALTKQRNQLRRIVFSPFIPNRLMHVRTDYHFTQKMLHLQLYVFLISVAQELWDLRKQLMHFADMLTHIPTAVSGMKFNRRVQGFSLQSLSNPSAQRKLSYSCMTMDGMPNSECDIVEEGGVPLVMSLPQMRNLGFRFELTPNKACWSCARIGMKKMVLKTATSTHPILDFDGLHRELIRHHREKRLNLREMQRAETTPILLDEREAHIEYQKSGRKVLRKDDWRDKKNTMKRMNEVWKGKTIYKIKDNSEIPEGIQKSDVDRLTRVSRGNLDELFHPEAAPPSKPVSAKKKPSSQQREAGKKKLTRGPSLKEIEVGPPAAKRHVGKQEPVVVGDSKEGSSKRKKVVVSNPHDGEDELDRIAREMNLQPDDDEPQVIESKSSAPARPRSKQDSEGQIEKLGSEALEPRRVSVPLPGSEAQAMTPPYKKMLRRLEDSVELYKHHVKHYHMPPTQFRRRTSMLGVPDSIYQKYEDVCNKCRVLVLPLHHRQEPGPQAFGHPTLEMSSLLTTQRFS